MIDMDIVSAVIKEIFQSETLSEGKEIAVRIAEAATLTTALIGRILAAAGVEIIGIKSSRGLKFYNQVEDAYSMYRRKIDEKYA